VKHVPAWFPFARFQRQALEWRPEILNSVQIPYARVKDALVSFPISTWTLPAYYACLKQAAGKATPSLVTRILEGNGQDMTEDHLMWFAGGLCKLVIARDERILSLCWLFWELSDSAAVDTSTTVILNFVLAMVLHPKAQRQAQDEIDSVIGRDRLPDLSEYVSLRN